MRTSSRLLRDSGLIETLLCRWTGWWQTPVLGMAYTNLDLALGNQGASHASLVETTRGCSISSLLGRGRKRIVSARDES